LDRKDIIAVLERNLGEASRHAADCRRRAQTSFYKEGTEAAALNYRAVAELADVLLRAKGYTAEKVSS
jgi:hypothetical protein